MTVLSPSGLTLLGADRRQPEFVIDANTQILNAAIPGNASGAIWARVYHNTTQSLTSATLTSLAFNSERWDTDVIHDVSTNNTRLTCKTAGIYLINGCASYAANATGRRGLAIRLNGATYLEDTGGNSVGAADATSLSVSTLYSLAVNDYVELIGYQSSGGALNVNSSANFSPEFAMARLGA